MNKGIFNIKAVIFMLGNFLFIESFFIGISSIVAFIYDEYDKFPLFVSALVTLIFASLFSIIGEDHDKKIRKREGYIIVSLVWVMFSLFGLLPFYISGGISNLTDAFFETMSSFTTTGSSILTNVEDFPHGLLFWRSLMQWLGGLGFVVLCLAIMPFIGGDFNMFSAETTGPIQDKMQPRIRETAKRLWGLYLFLTLTESLLLWLEGMDYFDAICHSLATLSTGGMSTKQMSIAYWDSPFIHYTIILFMIIGGTSFTLLYHSLVKQRFYKLFKNEEFKFYILFILLATTAVMLILFFIVPEYGATEKTIRDSLFHVTAFITSTAYSTTDYTTWPSISWLIFILLMITGSCSGSTTGGIKIVRILLLIKNSFYEFKRRLHPNAILPIKMNNEFVSEKVINSLFAFFTIYLAAIFLSIFILSISGTSLTDSFNISISTISNIGIGDFASLPTFSKWYLSFLMLVGRLELFTVLLLFSPALWKK